MSEEIKDKVSEPVVEPGTGPGACAVPEGAAPENEQGRVFVYDGHVFEDPGKECTVEDVRRSLQAFYPELANATVKEKKLPDGKTEITFTKTAGTKGGTTAGEMAKIIAGTRPLRVESETLRSILDGDFAVFGKGKRELNPARIEREVEKIERLVKNNRVLIRRMECIRPCPSPTVPVGF